MWIDICINFGDKNSSVERSAQSATPETAVNFHFRTGTAIRVSQLAFESSTLDHHRIAAADRRIRIALAGALYNHRHTGATSAIAAVLNDAIAN
jgi:hypothetical protein